MIGISQLKQYAMWGLQLRIPVCRRETYIIETALISCTKLEQLAPKLHVVLTEVLYIDDILLSCARSESFKLLNFGAIFSKEIFTFLFFVFCHFFQKTVILVQNVTEYSLLRKKNPLARTWLYSSVSFTWFLQLQFSLPLSFTYQQLLSHEHFRQLTSDAAPKQSSASNDHRRPWYECSSSL